MSGVFRVGLPFAWVVLLLSASTTTCNAAAAPESIGTAFVPTSFVDLMAPGSAPEPQAPAQAPSTPPSFFIDLTDGSSTALPAQPVRERFVDLTLGGSSADTSTSDEAETKTLVPLLTDQIYDPYEGANRRRFKTHVALHRYAIDPAERTYRAVVPELLRAGLHNLLTNLETPSVLANDLMQGNVDKAGNTLSRFVVNTTLGIGGIFDLAGKSGIPYRDDDFGQTLAVYGVDGGPYLLVPIIGPTNPRDLSGKVVDLLFNPLRYLTLPGGLITSVGETGLHELDKRGEDVGQLDKLARTAPDPYAIEREEASQRRNAEISGESIRH